MNGHQCLLIVLGQAGATAPTGPGGIPPVGALPVYLIWAFFILLGAAAAVPMISYALRKPQDPYAATRALVGGIGGSTLVAALSARIGGLPSTQLTWMEAVILSGTGFLVAAVVGCIGLAIYIHERIVKPTKRYGPGYTLRMLLAILTGTESLQALAAEVTARTEADLTWDELALAVVELKNGRIEQKPLAVRLLRVSLADGTNTPGLEDERAVLRALSDLLEPAIERFVARLTRTTLNFSVWRVSADKPELEHLISFPQRALYEHKKPLPIWHDPIKKSRVATVAGLAMLECQYCSTTTDDARDHGYVPRGLGLNYDAVGCLPIPCHGPGLAPWGVLCIENREGSIPLDSQTIRKLAGHLADVVAEVEFAVRKRSIEDARLVSAVPIPTV